MHNGPRDGPSATCRCSRNSAAITGESPGFSIFSRTSCTACGCCGPIPGFTAVAVLSLAIGIGANTAILSVIDAVLRAGLAIPNDDRLVVVRTFPLDNPEQETHALLDDYTTWRDANRSFSVMGLALGNQADFGADGDNAPAERIQGQAVTGGTLSALAVQPILGRVFTESETDIGPPAPVIVISHRLWQRRFGSRRDIIGQTARLDRVNRTIIGVMPDGFHYPNEGVEYWIPLAVTEPSRLPNLQRFFVVTGRLKDGRHDRAGAVRHGHHRGAPRERRSRSA